MDNASYIALSRQITLRRELDISANNLANMNTTGFKFEQLLITNEYGEPAKNDPIKAPANFAYDNGLGRDFRQGTMTQTGGAFDVAIAGDGAFFTVQTPRGTAYTRDGSFLPGPDGTLQTQSGYQVQGDGGPITIDPKNGEVTISADGILTQMVQGQPLRVGKLQVMRPDSLSNMRKEGDGTYSLRTGGMVPATDARVQQGMLESSNVNPMIEITKLVEINRAYSSIASVIEKQNELNRTAIERLGKVA